MRECVCNEHFDYDAKLLPTNNRHDGSLTLNSRLVYLDT